ncbi:hypothetical protein LR48_Vigan07g043400 [Vigna angularis]|uniref:SHSP domain-containing protein n=2 Tax=Phaseolus angularis TaxID=3914 RepID=A0A0L9UV36_PHAAN|nr:inactive protein RESTRICTED TEV MOVEMENT 2 [Vigna angularis]KAG2391058.1 uncharacterized protein HKW66_Vig0131810 [Vigna angularis]KOM46730.1 hypothetical protein LR48_Vigan07g043400 [Vigna angularis]BAT80945.1 hypothetical protein VIGAN_03057400 [Vigna angularis var. angularis]
MASRTQPASDLVYEDFEPLYELVKEERLVNVMLPGFRRDQLRVQVTSKPTLRVTGERLMYQNRYRRFNLELPIQSDYDTDDVTAKFEGSTLSIKFGKRSLNKPTEPATTPPQKIEQQKEDTPKAETKSNGDEVSAAEQKTPQKEEAKANGSSETKEETPAPKTRPVSRTKTRLIDFALGSGNQVDDEVVGDSDAGNNKRKKIVKWMVLIYAVVAIVALGLYAKNAFISNGESDTESFFLEL